MSFVASVGCLRAAVVLLCAGLGACAVGPSSNSSLQATGAEASAPEAVAQASTTPAAAPEAKPAAYTTASAIPARPGKPGACFGSQVLITVPPVPNKVGAAVSGIAENAGRNVARNVGTNLVVNNVAGRIPGIGGLVATAATQEAGKEVIRKAEDLRGTWTVADGSPRCGCSMDFEKSGLFVADYVAKPKGCQHPALAGAARYKLVGSGMTTNDLVLLAEDNMTEVARLDQKSYDYYQGEVGGAVITIWR